MKILKTLNNLQELIELRDLYSRDSEQTRHGYHTLSNFVRWFELEPHLDFVRVYVVNNTWRERGLFIIEDQYQLFINCLVVDEDEIVSALKSLNWNRRYKITALPTSLFDIVQRTLKELNVLFKMGTLGVYQKDNNKIMQNEVECPQSYEVRQLSISDATTINDMWYSRQDGSLDFLESLIKYNISLGVYTKDSDELIAWCTRCPCGFIGTLHVRDKYRRHGLASLLINEYCRLIAQQGDDARVMINEANRVSTNLFSKFQFNYKEKVHILFCEANNMTNTYE